MPFIGTGIAISNVRQLVTGVVETIPTLTGVSLQDVVEDVGAGTIQIATALAFAGNVDSYAVTGADAAVMNEATGVISLSIASALDVTLQVTATNSAGTSDPVPLVVLITAVSASRQVLNFVAADTGLTLTGHGLPTGNVPETGIWLSTLIRHDGTDFGNMRIMGLANPSTGTKYIQIHSSRIALRDVGSEQSPADFAFLTTEGWYLVTARIWREGADIRFQMRRNDLVSAVQTFSSSTFDLTNLTALGWSMTPDSSPTYGRHQMTGLMWGTGDPAAYHTAIYDGGTFADPAGYDFSADANAALVGSEAGVRNGTVEEDIAPSELDGAWVEDGDLEWVDTEPPYAAAVASGTITIDDELQPSVTGLGDVIAGETFAEIIARLTDRGSPTASNDSAITTTLTLTSDGADPVADTDVLSNVAFLYQAAGCADLTVNIPISVTVIPDPATYTENQTVEFDSGGLRTTSHGFPAALDADGVFVQGYVLYSGGGEFGNGRIAGLANPSAADEYIQVRASQVILRDGVSDTGPDLDFLTVAGWYLVTAHIWYDGTDVKARLWRNEEDSGEQTFVFQGGFPLTALTDFGMAMLPETNPAYGIYPMSGFTWGTGDPSARHQFLYNNGRHRNPIEYTADAANVLGYEPLARTSGVIEAVTPGTTGVSNIWTLEGTGAWADNPPPHIAGEFSVADTVTLATSGGASTLTLTSALPSLSWDNAAVDLSRIEVTSVSGYGPITATAINSLSTVTNTATLVLDLSREVYVGEVVTIDLQDLWIADDARNQGVASEGQAVTNNSASAVPALVPGMSNNGVSFEFNAPYTAGLTSDGIIWVFNPGGGAVIKNKYPLQDTRVQGGTDRTIHGTMKNPLRRSDNMQGYSSYGGFTHFQRYDPSLTVGFPVTLTTDETLIGVRNNLEFDSAHGGRMAGTTTRAVNILRYQGLIVVDSIPGANDFAPPLVGYDGTNRPAWRTVDVDAIVTGLPAGYDASTMDKPDFEVVINRIERFHPALFQFSQVEMKREMTPAWFTKGDGYGINFISTTGAVMLMLLSAESTLAQRTRAVRWIVHHYRQWYGLGRISSDGGHNQGVWGFLVLGDYWANGGAGLATLLADTGGNEQSAFQITDQAMLDIMTTPHTGGAANTDRPEFLELTTISAIDGNNINFQRIDDLNQDNTDTRNAVRATSGQNLRRPSDGLEIAFTGHNDNSSSANFGQMTVADASQLVVGDTVHIKAPWTQAVGDFEWIIRMTNGFREYSGSYETVYRVINQWSAEVMAVQALGLMHASFGQIRGYVEFANQSDQPTAGNDFPTHHNTFVHNVDEPSSETHTWDKQFWSQHWTAISGVTQVV